MALNDEGPGSPMQQLAIVNKAVSLSIVCSGVGRQPAHWEVDVERRECQAS